MLPAEGRGVTGYSIDAAEILRRLASGLKRMIGLNEALADVRDHLDRRPESVRDAIDRKRAEVLDSDRRRFVSATAHLPDDVFVDEPHPIREQLCAGLGRTRRILMVDLWHDEPRRRAARTGHEVIAEARLAPRLEGRACRQ